MNEESILDLLYELKKKCLVNDDNFMKTNQLSVGEYQFFIAYNKTDNIKSQTFSKLMDISLSRVSRIIDNMEKKGYLKREINKEDRRAIIIKLTPKGKQMQKKINDYRKNCEQKILSKVSQSKLKVIKDSFTTVLELL